MSARTPGLQPRSQFHAYWGQYAYDTAGAPPPPFFGRAADIGSQKLPNAPGNPLILPYVGAGGQLEAGDTASTVELVPSNGDRWGLWVCIYPGTAGGGDAVWERCDNDMAAVQTIRDAHVMVVAQVGGGFDLSNVYAATTAADKLNLSAVGDVVSVTCDYLDPGNGTALEQALLDAAASGVPIDIRLRPCNINLDTTAVTVPLVVPSNCRLLGAGRHISTVNSDVAAIASQEVFGLQAGSELIDLGIESGIKTGLGSPGASKAVVVCADGCRIERCAITVDGPARLQPWGIWDPTGTVEVLDTLMYGASQTNGLTPSIAIAIGADPAVDPDQYTEDSYWRVNGCHVSPIKSSGFNKAVYVYNVGGGHISECDFIGMSRPQLGVVQFDYAGAPLVLSLRDLLATVNDVRIEVDTMDEAGDQDYAGVAITDRFDTGMTRLTYFEWTAIRVKFQPAPPQTTYVLARIAFLVLAQTGAGESSNNQIEGGIINGCAALGDFNGGVLILGNSFGGGVATSLKSIRVGDGIFKDPVLISGEAVGIRVKTFTALDVIDAVGIANCSCEGAPAAGFGIDISQFAGSTVSNTIAIGNNLTPSGGTALGDSGTNTEAGHNILA